MIDQWNYNCRYSACRHWLESWILSRYTIKDHLNTLQIKYESIGSKLSNDLIENFLNLRNIDFSYFKVDQDKSIIYNFKDLNYILFKDLSNDWEKFSIVELHKKYSRMYFLKLFIFYFIQNPIEYFAEPRNSILMTLLIFLPKLYLKLGRLKYNIYILKESIKMLLLKEYF